MKPSADARPLRCVVVTGGGTAGHTVPTLPVIEHLLAQGCEVHFVGSHSGLEERLVKPLGVTYHGVSTGKLRRYFSLANLTDLVRIPLGVVQAWFLLGRIGPQVVFAKGGFVSFAAAVAGWLRRVPLVTHESDLTPGLANRLVAPLAQTVCVNFDETAGALARTVATGTPLRQALACGDAARGRALLGITTDKPVMLVVGGSLGATALNEVLRASLDCPAAAFRGGACVRARASRLRRLMGARAMCSASTSTRAGAMSSPPPTSSSPAPAPMRSTNGWRSASPMCWCRCRAVPAGVTRSRTPNTPASAG